MNKNQKFRHFCWAWVKLQASKNPEAQALVKLSLKVRHEPNRYAGRKSINEWLESVNLDFEFNEIVRSLETQYHNQKIFSK